LLTGATLRIIDVLAADPAELLGTLSAERISLLHATPTVFRYLLGRGERVPDLSAVRAVVLGGEEATAHDFALFRRCFGRHALLVNGLGPSESTTALQFFADHDTRLPGQALPVGLPVAPAEALVLDADGQTVAIAGELWLRSAYVSAG